VRMAHPTLAAIVVADILLLCRAHLVWFSFDGCP
jgi:hypothetical protein